MSTILVRQLDSNWDARRGASLANFLSDQEAVAQIITQRLKLLQGEWYEDTAEGTPVFQQLLGNAITIQSLSLILRQRILGSPYVTNIVSLVVTYGASGRTFNFTALVQTAFGQVVVSNVPST